MNTLAETPMNTLHPEYFLRLVLRAVGGVSMLALVAVVMPHPWMNATHEWLGLGPLPDIPVVGYLARSLSAFYALFGALLWMLSYDLQRHRPTLCFLGTVTIIFGLLLLGIDWIEGLPLYWRAGEGPWVIAIGAAILFLARRISPDDPGIHPNGCPVRPGGAERSAGIPAGGSAPLSRNRRGSQH